MWKIDESGTEAENKRAKTTMYACAAVIINDQYETRIAEMFDSIDEAKSALANIAAKENAEEAKELWQIDDNGNAHCPDGIIFHMYIPPNCYMSAQYIIVKKTNEGFVHTDFMGFAYDEDEARRRIQNLVDKYNDEDTDLDEETDHVES